MCFLVLCCGICSEIYIRVCFLSFSNFNFFRYFFTIVILAVTGIFGGLMSDRRRTQNFGDGGGLATAKSILEWGGAEPCTVPLKQGVTKILKRGRGRLLETQKRN